MDLNAVKLLLEAHERTFKSAMDIVIDQLKGRIQTCEGIISELTKSLEFSQAEIVDLKNQVKVIEKSDNEKQVEIVVLKSAVSELQQRINYQEDYSRRKNLRITGIQERQGGETWEQTTETVSNLLDEKLQLPTMKLERAHRVGPFNSSRPRTIVARFENFGDREAVVRNAKKLKGTNIYISDDLCPASQEKKRNQIRLLEQARQEGKIAYFKYTKLIIKEREGLPSRNASSANDSELPGRSSESTGRGAVVEEVAAPVVEPQSRRSLVLGEAAAAWPELGGATGVTRPTPAGSPRGSVNREGNVLTTRTKTKTLRSRRT